MFLRSNWNYVWTTKDGRSSMWWRCYLLISTVLVSSLSMNSLLEFTDLVADFSLHWTGWSYLWKWETETVVWNPVIKYAWVHNSRYTLPSISTQIASLEYLNHCPTFNYLYIIQPSYISYNLTLIAVSLLLCSSHCTAKANIAHERWLVVTYRSICIKNYLWNYKM